MRNEVKPLCIRLSDKIDNLTETQYENILYRMFYDPIDGINKISTDTEDVPAVLFNPEMGTSTFTRVIKESTDTDVQEYIDTLLSTKTYTEVKSEITDDDPSSFASLGTMTHTNVQLESTDQDPEQGL